MGRLPNRLPDYTMEIIEPRAANYLITSPNALNGPYKVYDGKTRQMVHYETTDAGAAIQWAIDNLPEHDIDINTGGGSICLVDLLYKIESKIIIDRPIDLFGFGKSYMTELVAMNELNDRIIEIDDTHNFHYQIHDLQLSGNKYAQSGGDYVFYGPNCYATIFNFFIMNGFAGGMYIPAQDSYLFNVYVEFCDGYGIDATSGNHKTFIDVTCWQNGERGLYFGGDRGNIIGGRFCNNTKQGIYLGGKWTGCCNNVCINNGEEGIMGINCTYATISDNMCIDNGKTANNTYDAIRLYNSNHVVVKGNIINTVSGNAHRYSINEDSGTANRNIIIGNVALGGATGQIHLQAGSNTI